MTSMSKTQRLSAFAVLMVFGALGFARPGAASGGCFTYNNSSPIYFPDDSGGIGTYQCAGTATTTCTECISTDPGYQVGDCVFSSTDDVYCHYSN
jgi:hypothetical protein